MGDIQTVDALVNGSPADSVSSHDRGLSYGDGLFETLAIVEGAPRDWEAHLGRLRQGCERLAMPFPDPDQLQREAARLCQGVECGVFKLIITRGPGGRGYRRPAAAAPATRILLRFPRPDYPAALFEIGIDVHVCTTRLARNPMLAGIKHLNRLEQVLARNEWSDQFHEGLMRDTEGYVVEGTMSNLFVISGDTLRTPDLSQAGIAGIVRERILQSAGAEGIEAVVEPVTLEQVRRAESLFFCNSIIGIWPVHTLAGRVYERPVLIDRLAAVLKTSQCP